MKMIVAGVYSDAELAAVVTAVSCVLAEEAAQSQDTVIATSAWRAAAKLEGQGLVAARQTTGAQWGYAARANRARRWSKGIVGS